MAEQKPIIIDNFQKGIADSPLLGFGKLMNVDINSRPGTAMINYSAVKTSSTNITSYPVAIVKNPTTGYFYAYTFDCYLHSSALTNWGEISGNTKASGGGLNAIVWKDYLFCFRAGNIDAYGPLSGTPQWTNNMQAITTDTNYHAVIVGQDDRLYIGARNYVGSIVANGTFDATNSGTWTYEDQALTLPAGYEVTCFAELGQNLYVGTQYGLDVFGGRADIFPWDRVSSSFDFPIRLPEHGVRQMISIGNRIYVVAGKKHHIYVLDGVSNKLLNKLSLLGIRDGYYLETKINAIMSHNGKIYTAPSCTLSSSIAPLGVYSLDPETGVLNFENQLSTGKTHGDDTIIGSLASATGDIYYIGWGDGKTSTYGIDQVGASVYNTAYETLMESPLYKVGTKYNKRTFQYAEFELADLMVSTEGVRLSYRENLSDSWTVIGTSTYATDGAVKSQRFQFGQSLESVQIKCELKGTSTMCLKSITLY